MIQAALCKYLATQGHGTHGVPGSSLTIEQLPTAPVVAACVATKTAPAGDYGDQKTEGIQIIVRGTKGEGTRPSYQRAIAIRDNLHGLRKITLDDGGPDETRVLWIRSDGDTPVNLGDDANGNPRWSLRFLAGTFVVTANTIL